MTLPHELIVSGGIAGEVPDHKAQAIILAALRTLRDKGPSEEMKVVAMHFLDNMSGALHGAAGGDGAYPRRLRDLAQAV